MEQREGTVEVENERLLGVRAALSHRLDALMRAWWLGIAQPRDDDERDLYRQIVEVVGEPGERRLEGAHTPLAVRIDPPGEEGLTRLTDEEYLAIFDQLMTRLELLRQAFERGMIAAGTAEQEVQLTRIRELLER